MYPVFGTDIREFIFMKSSFTPKTVIGKIGLGLLGLVGVGFMISFFIDRHRSMNPGDTFLTITGRALPDGVVATRYGFKFEDNLFQRTHYWVLEGNTEGLRAVTEDSGFMLSEDARFLLPDVQELFGLPFSREDILAGYEWELDRDRWYWIFRDQRVALYAH